MKRIAVIVTLACLVVAMTTGSAFVRACADDACGDSMVCAPGIVQTCPMGDGETMQHSACDHGPQAQAHEAVSADPGHAPAALPAQALITRPVLELRGLFRSPRAPDARGAPHLSAVIRT